MGKRTMAMRAAAYHLKARPMTCSSLGSLLWGRPHRKTQSYARPAGKLLHHMKRLGLVECRFDGRHFYLWGLLPGWAPKLDAIKD